MSGGDTPDEDVHIWLSSKPCDATSLEAFSAGPRSDGMTMLSCEQTELLLGAYALDALTAPEGADVRSHIESCAEHRQALDELRQTVSLLALSIDEIEPSPELRQRVLESIRLSSPEPPVSAATGPVVVPIRRAPRLPRWAPRPALAAIAAGVLLAVGGGALAGYQLGQQQSAAVAYNFKGRLVATGVHANLIYLRDRHQAMLAVNGLPALPPGQVYEMWLVNRAGRPVAEGVTTAQDGRINAQMDADLSQFRQFAITVEPGERPSPTTPAVLEASLSGGSA